MQPEQQGSWAYKPEQTTPQAPTGQPLPQQATTAPTAPTSEGVNWTASEFISHHKSAGWYAGIGSVIFMLCVIIFLATKDIISVIFITIVAILFFVISAKKPEQKSYAVDDHGIYMGEKFYPYNSFKSYSIVDEGAISSIVFLPLKRFMPELTVFYAPNDEDRILGVLSANLPNHQRKELGVDKLMKRLRF